MILVCLSCHTRYLISANLFAGGPRQVRCARCHHIWHADVPNDTDAVGFADLTPPPDGILPLQPGSNVPALRKALSPRARKILKIVAGMVSIILVGSLFLFRQSIGESWPPIEKFYNGVGLHIDHFGEGLNLENVRSELHYDRGGMQLMVEGKINNSTQNIQEIPNIKAIAIGADGKAMESWQIDAPAPRVGAGETVGFQSTVKAPEGTVSEINLSFIEIKHDNE